MSNVFNLDTLSFQNINSKTLTDYTMVEESYFIQTLNFISESKYEMRNHSKVLYKSILESNMNHELINESFSDFFEKIKEIIDKFLQFIKSLFNRFVTAFNKLISSDKYIKNHKEDFSNFSSADEFEYKGYVYTFDSDIPLIDAQAEFSKEFVSLDFDGIKDEKDAKKVIKAINDEYEGLMDALQGEYYDNFRKEVIGAKTPIPQSEFATELFEIFRNGSSEKEDIIITSSEVLESYNRFTNYKDIEKDVRKTKEKIEKDYEDIKKKIKSMVYRNKDGNIDKLIGIGVKSDYNGSSVDSLQVPRDAMSKIDSFIKAKCNQVVDMSAIHSMAFSYKLDAISECYKQDRNMLYQALNKVQKLPKKEA